MRILTLLLSGLLCSGVVSAATPVWTPSRMMHELLGPLYPQRAMFFGGNKAAATGGGGGIALVNGSIACAGGTNGGTSIQADATAANLAVIPISFQPGVSLTVADSNTGVNTWACLTVTSGTPNNNICYAKDFHGTGTQTFSVTGTSGFIQFKPLLFSGVTTSAPFDKQTTGETAGTNTITPGALTPTSADSLFITGYARDTTAAATGIDSGFTSDGACAGDGSTKYGVGAAHLIQSGGPTSANPAWSFPVSSGSGIAKNSVFK